ncbi:hypothetical protein [Nocardioides sp. SYSU D00065]|uniref:hypothetical protein n=1 Tax=Nocardioides sp. SYSU D00065 TaxID=2817378 RepID=UPI001B32DBC9|nr:hypothetical protein [Nocardioides sp. SYSU D00065]
MSNTLGHLLTAAVVTLVVGTVSGGGWAYYLVGAVLALSLWAMLLAGSYASATRDGGAGRTSARQYAVAAAVALVLGSAMYVVGDGGSWWAVGFIFAGALVPATAAATRDRTGDGA